MPILTNRKLELLAHGLAKGKSAVEAARDAGYNTAVPSFAANAAQRASKPIVKARVKELMERAAEKLTVDVGWVLGKLVEVAGVPLDPADVRTSDKLRALELIAKVRGYFAPEKREIIQRLTELSLDQLKALDDQLTTAEQPPPFPDIEPPPAEELH